MSFRPQVRDLQFALDSLVDAEALAGLEGYGDYSAETAGFVLDEAGRFAESVLEPLNVVGDRQPAVWDDGKVTASPGFGDAYQQFVEAGWNGLKLPTEFGGQGLPQALSTCVEELWNSANLSYALCPMLTCGAIEALLLCGSDALKQKYLPKMVTGEWTGTMNLTEPQAGSDLAAVRTRAEPQGDGTFKISGQKIFITWGEHDMTDNIVHLVLARLPDAPPGVKGISLFTVPKFLLNEDGSPGERNDVRCVSIEHKLGIHASPTCALSFGDNDGALGEMVGEPNKGLEYMFIMMNLARFSVGVQGIGLAERAYQKARDYAFDRVQGKPMAGELKTIAGHPDVRRMLLDMRCDIEAMRALAITVGAAMDFAHRSNDEALKAHSDALVELLIPVVKAWSTEVAQRIAYDGQQVHGGMGFVEETGAAQYLRDVRIITIYEGTTAIQANDFVGRKLGRNGGRYATAFFDDMRKTAEALRAAGGSAAAMAEDYAEVLKQGEAIVAWIVEDYRADAAAIHAASVPALLRFGRVAGAWAMAKLAVAAQAKVDAGDDVAFHATKLELCGMFIGRSADELAAGVATLRRQAARVMAFDEALL